MGYMMAMLAGFVLMFAANGLTQRFDPIFMTDSFSKKNWWSLALTAKAEPASEVVVLSEPLAPAGHTRDASEPLVKFFPQYPADAAAKHIEGYVTLRYSLATDGRVQELKIIESQPPHVFDDAARDAVSRWKFEAPGRSAGRAEEQKLRLVFSLDERQAQIR